MPRYTYGTMKEARHRKHILDAGVSGQSRIEIKKRKLKSGKIKTTYVLVVKSF